MRQTNFFRFRLGVAQVFLLLAIAVPIVVIKLYEGEYGLDFMEKLQIWLLLDGALLILEAIVFKFINSIPIMPDVIPLPPRRDDNKREG